jgi:hypothetical protein
VGQVFDGERERGTLAYQPGSSGGSAEGFFWRLRRAIRVVLRFGVRHMTDQQLGIVQTNGGRA